MESADVYVLVNLVDEQRINEFRLKYLLDFEQTADYYEYPFYSPSGQVDFETNSVDEMLTYVLQKRGRNFRFYFKNKNPSDIFMGMIFFNKDGSVLLGLSVLPDVEEYYREELMLSLNSTVSAIYYFVTPPDNSSDFGRS